jgi:hypothetical protein
VSLPDPAARLLVCLCVCVCVSVCVCVWRGVCGVWRVCRGQPLVEVDAQNNQGDTPLHVACASKHFGAVKLLVRAGERPHSLHVANTRGKLPMDYVSKAADPASRQIRAYLVGASSRGVCGGACHPVCLLCACVGVSVCLCVLVGSVFANVCLCILSVCVPM